MSSRMRVTKGHTRNRRSHHALKAPRLSKCSNCMAYYQRHRACLECGFYKGTVILDIKDKVKNTIKSKDGAEIDKKEDIVKDKEETVAEKKITKK